MRTITHRLTWPDGATAAVTIVAAHPNDVAPLSLSGDTARLATLPVEEWSSVVAVQLRQLAAAESATLDTTATGEWRAEDDVM